MAFLTGSMTSWKTTLTALVVLGVFIADKLGYSIPPDVQLSLVTIALAIIGILSRDANKSSQGGTVESVGSSTEPAVMEKVPSIDVSEAAR